MKPIEEQLEEIKLMIASKKELSDLMTVDEVLSFLSIGRNTFDRMLRDGSLKAYRLRRRIYCKRSEILETLFNNPMNAA